GFPIASSRTTITGTAAAPTSSSACSWARCSRRAGGTGKTAHEKLRSSPGAAIHVGCMDTGITSINDQVKDASAFAYKLREEIGTVVVGQRYLVDRLLVGLLANGHVLLEGVPGLAKTLSVKTLAQAVSATF